jgi:hypothetical protein
MADAKRNTGTGNTGYCNTGHCNTGNRNTGNHNTGHCNTGHWNTGNCNTGHCNTGSYNTGHCNTITPDDCLIFNKPAKRLDWDLAVKPNWIYAKLTRWVSEGEMSNKEKDAFPSYVTCGGYLKAYASLQDAWKEAWSKASPEDRAITLLLPNFDPDIFEEIFGFRADVPDKTRKVTLDLTEKQIAKIQRILGNE